MSRDKVFIIQRIDEQKQGTQTLWGAAEGGASVFFVSAHLFPIL